MGCYNFKKEIMNNYKAYLVALCIMSIPQNENGAASLHPALEEKETAAEMIDIEAPVAPVTPTTPKSPKLSFRYPNTTKVETVLNDIAKASNVALKDIIFTKDGHWIGSGHSVAALKEAGTSLKLLNKSSKVLTLVQ